MTKKKLSQNQKDTQNEKVRTRSMSKSNQKRAQHKQAETKKAKEHRMDIEFSKQQQSKGRSQKDNKTKKTNVQTSNPISRAGNRSKGDNDQKNKLREEFSSDSSDGSLQEIMRGRKPQQSNENRNHKFVGNTKGKTGDPKKQYQESEDNGDESEEEEIEILQKILETNLKKRRRDPIREFSPPSLRKKTKKQSLIKVEDSSARGRTKIQEIKIPESSVDSFEYSPSHESLEENNPQRRASSSSSLGRSEERCPKKKKDAATLEIETNKKPIKVRKHEKLARKAKESELVGEIPTYESCQCHLTKFESDDGALVKEKDSQKIPDVRQIILQAIKVVKERPLEDQIIDYLNHKYPNFAALIVKHMVHKLLTAGKLSPEEVFQKGALQKETQICVDASEKLKIEKTYPEEGEDDEKTPERQQAQTTELPPTKKKTHLDKEIKKENLDTNATARKPTKTLDEVVRIEIEAKESDVTVNKLEGVRDKVQGTEQANEVIVVTSNKNSPSALDGVRSEEPSCIEVNGVKKINEEDKEYAVEVIVLNQLEANNNCDKEIVDNGKADLDSGIPAREIIIEIESPKLEKPTILELDLEWEKSKGSSPDRENSESFSSVITPPQDEDLEVEVPEENSVQEICSGEFEHQRERSEQRIQVICCESIHISEDSIISADASVPKAGGGSEQKSKSSGASNGQDIAMEAEKKNEQIIVHEEDEEVQVMNSRNLQAEIDVRVELVSQIPEESMFVEEIQKNILENTDSNEQQRVDESQADQQIVVEVLEEREKEQTVIPMTSEAVIQIENDIGRNGQNIEEIEGDQSETGKKDGNNSDDQPASPEKDHQMLEENQEEEVQRGDQKADFEPSPVSNDQSQNKIEDELQQEVQIEEEESLQHNPPIEIQNETVIAGSETINEGNEALNETIKTVNELNDDIHEGDEKIDEGKSSEDKEKESSDLVNCKLQTPEKDNNIGDPKDQPNELAAAINTDESLQHNPESPPKSQLQNQAMEVVIENDEEIQTMNAPNETFQEDEHLNKRNQIMEEEEEEKYQIMEKERLPEDSVQPKAATANLEDNYDQPIVQQQTPDLNLVPIEEKAQNVLSNPAEVGYHEEKFDIPKKSDFENENESNLAIASETIQSQPFSIQQVPCTSQIEEISFICSNNQASACDLMIEEFSTPIFQPENYVSESQINQQEPEPSEQRLIEADARHYLDSNETGKEQTIDNNDPSNHSDHVEG